MHQFHPKPGGPTQTPKPAAKAGGAIDRSGEQTGDAVDWPSDATKNAANSVRFGVVRATYQPKRKLRYWLTASPAA